MTTGKWGSRQGGFTIVELSLVLIIIALVSSIGITASITTLEAAKRSQTESKLNVIEAAMATYRVNNNRLPCPANLTLTTTSGSYGVESGSPGECSGSNYGSSGNVVEGGIPTRTLNIPEDFMYDGWGRRFTYAVDSNATEIDAFNTINIPEQCGIRVNDASGNPRSGGAVYALVSHGSDGHGGYLRNGMRMSTGATNADVLTNCHCTSQAQTLSYEPTFVQKEVFEDPNFPQQSFTNIVRYKERWQLITQEDQFSFAQFGSYRGPNVAVGFAMTGDGSAYTYKLQCGKLIKDDDLDPPTNDATTGAVISQDNRYLVTFSNAGCMVYPISDDKVETGNPLSVPGCPAYNTSVRVEMSKNGFMAMTAPVAPYIFLWQKSGSYFVPLATPSPAPVGPLAHMSLTANYLMLSDGSALTVYGRSSSTYTDLSTQPAGVPGSIFSATLSPNENYLVVTTNGNVSGTPAPQIYIWRIDAGPVFTPRTTVSINANDTPYSATFSPDGSFFAVGGTNGDNIVIYKIEAGDKFTRLNRPTGWVNSSDSPGISFAFSRDSRFIVMGTASGSRPVALFRQSSAKQYKYMEPPKDVQPYPAISVRFNY